MRVLERVLLIENGNIEAGFVMWQHRDDRTTVCGGGTPKLYLILVCHSGIITA